MLWIHKSGMINCGIIYVSLVLTSDNMLFNLSIALINCFSIIVPAVEQMSYMCWRFFFALHSATHFLKIN